MYATKGLYAMVHLVPLQSCAELFKDLACYVKIHIHLKRYVCKQPHLTPQQPKSNDEKLICMARHSCSKMILDSLIPAVVIA